MRSPLPLAPLLALGVLALGGCGRQHETKMIDPRTGAAAYCYSERANLFTPSNALLPLQACVNELAYYGFRDEAWLRAAQQAPPAYTQPLPAPQPLPWLPPQGVRGPDPAYYAPPVYSGPVSPAY